MSAEMQESSGPLYRSPWGLLDFQADGVVHALVAPTLAVWDTGLGKSHLDMATAGLMFEDDAVDIHLLVCEQNKIDEWVEDFATYTSLRVVDYGGANMSLAYRRKVMDAIRSGQPTLVKRGLTVDRPQVLVATYETFRNDLAVKEKKPNAKGRLVEMLSPGPLSLALSGKRVLLGFDEMTKIGSRASGAHKSQVVLLKHLDRTGGSASILGLTATPIERDPENYYNLGRILCPADVGTVQSFEDDHVVYRNVYGQAMTFKNLTPETTFEGWVTPLSVKMGKVLHRKRWTDEDVVHIFPEVSERFLHVRLSDKHQAFYETVRDVFAETSTGEEDDRFLFVLMRQIAGHPLSLLHSESKFARTIVDEVGEDGLRALGAAKLDRLVDRLKTIVLGEGAQAVVFTFFGPSMIPYIAQRLDAEKISVALNYPEVGDKVRAQHKAEFKGGDRRVFLSSDAGARGINLPQATYAFEYEMALTHALRTQRLNRAKRLDSRSFGSTHVDFQSLIAIDTIEDGIAGGVMRRNAWADALLDDDDPGDRFVSAEDRKRLLAISRRAV